ncbi:YHYH protein [Rubellicoccus peritrichatus]|uniref:YHYH protein n=1 Tax=Rubellicoccus peritrichatus TaxID=3080537 RepID=A0AAQ3LD55_9BACT|nr:YHYH protein [Puniceicoccus sp. CR14]WOO39829.1 YHYH protein [Puniceicoccus sp. CR14]
MKIALVLLSVIGFTLPSLAHNGHHSHGPSSATATNEVEITTTSEKRIIESNGIPNHSTGQFPGRGNPHEISVQFVRYEIPLTPREADKPIDARGYALGVALNGVKIDVATAEFWNNQRGSIWNEEAIVNGKGRLGLDGNNAHVQPTGAYHYHGVPNGLIEELGGEGKMVQVGWAADGYPIYGPWAYSDPMDPNSEIVEMKPSYRLKTGTRPGGNTGPGGRYNGMYTADFEYAEGLGDLDESNGRIGITPEFPQGTYYYVLTNSFPYVPRYFHGIPDRSFRMHGGGDGGPHRGHPGMFGSAGRFGRPPPPPQFRR